MFLHVAGGVGVVDGVAVDVVVGVGGERVGSNAGLAAGVVGAVAAGGRLTRRPRLGLRSLRTASSGPSSTGCPIDCVREWREPSPAGSPRALARLTGRRLPATLAAPAPVSALLGSPV